MESLNERGIEIKKEDFTHCLPAKVEDSVPDDMSESVVECKMADPCEEVPPVLVKEKTVGFESPSLFPDLLAADTQETALEDLEQELDNTCRQQAELKAKLAELEAKREDVLKRIEEAMILYRNEFYAGFYKRVLRTFKIHDDIDGCVNKKQFDDYLKTLIEKLLDNRKVEKIIWGDEILRENLLMLINATGIKITKEDLESSEALTDFCTETCKQIQAFRLKAESVDKQPLRYP